MQELGILCCATALFLLAINLMGSGVHKAAGERLERLLERLTHGRLQGFLLGTVVTAAVQSSRLGILYAARRNRLRRRARDLLFGNQRIPGVFIWAAPRDCAGAHWRIFSANAAV